MKILLEECLPRPLIHLLTGHEAKTVRQMGWNGKENGDLIALAVKHFECFITVDKSLRHQ
jgi:predicted nuclease of predicted toxin-antitoxin system